MAVSVDRTTTEAGAYPVILLSYLVACQDYEDAAEAENVKGYLSYIVSDDGQAGAADFAGSAPLAPATAEQAQKIVDTIGASSSTRPVGAGSRPAPPDTSVGLKELCDHHRFGDGADAVPSTHERLRRRRLLDVGPLRRRRPGLPRPGPRRRSLHPRRPGRRVHLPGDQGRPGLVKDADVYELLAGSFAATCWPLLSGTVMAALIALLIAAPLAFGIALVIATTRRAGCRRRWPT